MLSQTIAELERCYVQLSKRFPDPVRLRQLPVITTMPAGRKQCLGWMGPRAWQDTNVVVAAAEVKHQPNEIVLCAEVLARPVADIMETLLHEMVHHYNALGGVKDCSDRQWHNKRFKEVAELVGLVVEKQPGRGYAATKLGESACAAVMALQVDPSLFLLHRPSKVNPSKESKRRTFHCACDAAGVQADPRCFEARCLKCQALFRYKES